MLSMSSFSASPSSTWLVVKKLVGGICLGSPTTMTALPRAMAPTASLVGICEASSNTTRSNFSWSRSMNCATEMGLMSMQGHSLGSKVGIWSRMLRMEVLRPPEAMHRFRMPISELLAASMVSEGMREANWQ